MATTTSSPIKTKARTIDGLSIRYAESAPREVSAILLSPWPESLYTFEQMWSRLAEHAHLVAIDLPGFGHSERKDELLTSSAMGEFVAHVIDACGRPGHWYFHASVHGGETSWPPSQHCHRQRHRGRSHTGGRGAERRHRHAES